jgi:angiomotin like 1
MTISVSCFLSTVVYSTSPAYNLLNNNDYTPSSASIVSSTPTTPYYNATNYENLMPSSNSSKTVSATSNTSFDALLAGAYSGLYHQQNYGPKLSSVPPTSSGISPNTSCSSTSNTMQHKHQEPSITSSSSASNYLNYDHPSLDEQRKSIDDQLKKLDNQLLTKVSELTLMQQQHIQLQQQQNRNLKSKNAALIHNSRASSLSLCGASPVAASNRGSINVANNLTAQSAFSSNSMQSLPINCARDDEEQEVFY